METKLLEAPKFEAMPHSNDKYTDEQIIKELIAFRGMVYLAARSLGCSATTIYNRMDRNPAIKDALESARGEIVDLAEEKLYKAIRAEQPWAIALVLKTLGKNRGYIERLEQDIQAKVITRVVGFDTDQI